MKKLFFVLAVLVIVMAFTNPSQDDYNSWVNDKLAQKLNYNSEGTIGKAISPMTSFLLGAVSEKHNYVIFSIYETKASKTLGIFKMFFDLK